MARLRKGFMACCIWPLGWQGKKQGGPDKISKKFFKVSFLHVFPLHPASLYPRKNWRSPCWATQLKLVLITHCSDQTLSKLWPYLSMQLRSLKILVVSSNHMLGRDKDEIPFWVLTDTGKLWGALTGHKQSALLHCPSAPKLFLD